MRGLALILLAGCPAAPAPAPCSAVVTGTVPADGDVAVHPDTPVRIAVEGDAEAVRVWIDGGVTGGWIELPAAPEITFTPAAPFVRGAHHTMRVEACGATTTASFDTLGPPVTADLAGNVYALDLRDEAIEWLLPAGLGAVTEYLAENSTLLILVREAGATLSLTVAVGQSWLGEIRQYDCLGPHSFEPVDFSSNPDFSVGPVTFTLSTTAADYTIESLLLDGTFTADGTALARLRVRGDLDVRRIQENTRVDICAFAEAADDPCVPCEGQTDGESCLPVDAVAYAIPLSDVPVDPEAEPACE